MRILHTGDLHLDSPFCAYGQKDADKQREAGRELLRRIFDCAKDEKCEMILIAGDLFDSRFVTPESAELFRLCRADGISCALDTSGCVYNESVEHLLSLTDLVLLDYKYTNDTDYKKYTGMSMQSAEDFLARLDALGKRVWIRQVIIPTLNDSEESVRRLYALSERYSCIEKTELLPFRKLCVEKYRALGIDFPLENIPEASEELIERLKRH